MEDMIPLMLERLEAGYEVTFSPYGTSMLPMLRQGRDTVTLRAPSGRLSKYDLPLYRRDNGQYVLHRVVRVGETYACMGDNQFVLEEGIREDQILAVCTAVTRKGKRQSLSSLRWRIYAVLWHRSRLLRRVILGIWRRTLGRLFRKRA